MDGPRKSGAFEDTEVSRATCRHDGTELYDEAAYAWSIAVRALVARSWLSSGTSQNKLFVSQAQDELTSVFEPSGALL